MAQFEADLISTMRSLSRAGDINKQVFLDHAERVAHIAYHLGRKLDWTEAELNELVLSALLHDVGILTSDEQLALADLEPVRERVSAHCLRGYRLVRSISLFSGLFFLVKDDSSSNRLVIALSVRVALAAGTVGLFAWGFYSGQLVSHERW